jgi:hypothetical protein
MSCAGSATDPATLRQANFNRSNLIQFLNGVPNLARYRDARRPFIQGRESIVMFLAMVGLGLCLWAIGSGFGSPALGRTGLFVGPIGFVANVFVLLMGFGLMAIGFGFVIL